MDDDFEGQPWEAERRQQKIEFDRIPPARLPIASYALHAARDTPTRFCSGNQLAFLGAVNISNGAAVRNLIKMGEASASRYVHYGSASGLNLPGVRVHVLGPPTVEQSEGITGQRRQDADEFWQIMAASALNQNADPPFLNLSSARADRRDLRAG